MPNRSGSDASPSEQYSFGYQGSEKDPEVHNESYTTEFRQLDTRIARWLSIDPLAAQFPWQSPYVSMDNNPIFFNDPFGDSTYKEKSTGSKNVAVIHMSTSDIEAGLHKEYIEKEGKEGWDYIITDDLNEASDWMDKNYKKGEIENLVIRQHSWSNGVDGENRGLYHTDANGQRQILTTEELNNSKGDDESEDKLIRSYKNMFSYVSATGTITNGACSFASKISTKTSQAPYSRENVDAWNNFVNKPFATKYVNTNPSVVLQHFFGKYSSPTAYPDNAAGWISTRTFVTLPTYQDIRIVRTGIALTRLRKKKKK